MKSVKWSEVLEPPRGGWSRLQSRLEAQDAKQRFELRLLTGLSAAMIGALVLVNSVTEIQLPQPQPGEKVVVENARVVEREGALPGVHYYWVFQE